MDSRGSNSSISTTFACGCSFEENGEEDGNPLYKFSSEDINLYCPKTWELYRKGLTKGIFQLESNFGRKWAKRLAPENIEQLAGLISVLRPSCINSLDENDVSLTEHYCLRKNRKEDSTVFHESLKEILSETFQILVYQEQTLNIAKELGGFSLQEADKLRKGIGEKVEDIVIECQELFLEKAKIQGIINEMEAKEIFSWIRKGSRYQFNKSHAVSYALLGYDTAFIKAHFPLAFFTAWAIVAKNKAKYQDEIRELLNEAKLFGIYADGPSIEDQLDCFNYDNGRMKFGLLDIKGIGDSHVKKIRNSLKNDKRSEWLSFLCFIVPNMGQSISEKLIRSGALPFILPRSKMLGEVDAISSLTKKELEWVHSNYKNFSGVIDLLYGAAKPKKEGGGASNKNRTAIVSSHAKLLEAEVNNPDSLPWIRQNEEGLLGISLTSSRLDEYNTKGLATCREFVMGDIYDVDLLVQMDKCFIFEIKKGPNTGKEMASFSFSDETGEITDAIMWTNTLELYKDELCEGEIYRVQGKRDQRTRQTLIVDEIHAMEKKNEYSIF